MIPQLDFYKEIVNETKVAMHEKGFGDMPDGHVSPAIIRNGKKMASILTIDEIEMIMQSREHLLAGLEYQVTKAKLKKC